MRSRHLGTWNRQSSRLRRLSVETLEDRRLLSVDPFPVPLVAVEPSGSLIYDSTASAEIAAAGEIDSFSIDLNADQTLSVVVDGEASLWPIIALTDPDGSHIAAAAAAAAGEDALLQTIPTTAAGTYIVSVGSAHNTTGAYTVQLILNAAVETEEHDGPRNDEAASAEDLDGSFIPIGDGQAQRGGVLGSLAPGPGTAIDADDFESGLLGGQWTASSSTVNGRVQVTGDYGTADGSYALLMDVDTDWINNLNEAIWTVDVSAWSRPVLSFFHAEWSDEETLFAGDFTGSYNADGVAISDDGVNWHPAWNPTNQSVAVWQQVTVDLAAEAAAAGMTLGSNFQIKFQQYDNYRLMGDGRGYDEISIAQPFPAEDWYRFSLAEQQTATVALATAMPSPAKLELFDGDLNLLAVGTRADTADQVVVNFRNVDTGQDGESYLVRVSNVAMDYGLVITRDGNFEARLADPFAPDVQDITLGGTVLGEIGADIDLPITFAVFGDYGSGSQNEENVANMVKSWYPDFIVTTGDNNYGPLDVGHQSWTDNIGRFYGDFMLGRSDNLYPEQTSPIQRFFPTVGNHDSEGGAGSGGDIPGYIDYFHDDPEGGRLPDGVHTTENSYYDFTWGPIHFFAIDSDHARVDAASMAAQQEWLETALTNSTATWKFVVFHHPPYSSGMHGSDLQMQWPFQQWGADAVFNGHDHTYERLLIDDVAYFVSGIGGATIYEFGEPIPGSVARYTADFGSMRVSVDAGSATFDFLSLDDGANGGNGGSLIDSYTIDRSFPVSYETDAYHVQVQSGDQLVLETFTPADGPGQFVNALDPAIELYDPAGLPLDDNDNGAADGRNARLTHTATAAGTYTVRVRDAASTGGEYVLTVNGHSGALPAFEVAATDPADGGVLELDPVQMTVDFNHPLLLSTLDASDLTIGAVTATAVAVIDGNTAVFDLPTALSGGLYAVTIAAGTILDLQGTPIEAFTASVAIDTSGPRVIASSLREGYVVGIGSLFYAARFDEELDAEDLDPADVQLIGGHSGSYIPTLFDYNPASSTLTLQFDDLADDNYTLTLLSGNGAFEDIVGNDLDGEADPVLTVPSGDGIAGGDFVVNFFADADLLPFPTPLVAKQPLGSLIYDPLARGTLDTFQATDGTRTAEKAGDSDAWTIDLDAGQTITVVVAASAELQVAFDVLDPGGNVIGSATAAEAGETAVVQTAPVTTAGTYQAVLSAVSGGGTYTIQILLNTALEQESYAGSTNDTPATAEDLDGTFISLDGDEAQRGAVIGVSPVGMAVDSEDFESGILDGQWTTYSSSTPEGRVLVTGDYGTADGSYALWMDRNPGGDWNLNEAIWTVDLSGLQKPVLSFYHAEWNDEEQYLSPNFTDHYNADGISISDDGVNWYPVFHVPDLPAGEWHWYPIDLAARAAAAGITLGPDFQIKFQQLGADLLTADGRGFDEIKITMPDPQYADWYRFTLDDGESASLVAALVAAAPGSLSLDLYDSSQNLLTRGIAAENAEQVIGTFLDTTSNGTAETYYVRVAGHVWLGYSLVITRNAAFDAEPNYMAVAPQDITSSGVALGHVSFSPGGTSSEREKLVAHDADHGANFGNSVSISGNTAIVGAPGADSPAYESGAADIFQFDGNQWIQQQELVASDAFGYDHFGYSVSLNGNTAIVGAYGDDDGGPAAGSAYIFQYDGIRWNQQQKLTASDAEGGELFGYSVSISGDTAIVGAFGDDDNAESSGSAYIFRYDANQWVEQQKLHASDANVEDLFGKSVYASGDTVIVGAYGDDEGGENSGAAYIFHFDGTQWYQQQKLAALDADPFDSFGGSVSINGDTAIIGASGDDEGGENSGAAYIFRHDGSQWSQQRKLIASDATTDGYFGRSISISDDTVLVGSSGLAYVYQFVGGQWIEQKKLRGSDSEISKSFGGSVAVLGATALVGAHRAVPVPEHSDTGIVYFFPLSFPADDYAVNVRAGDVLSVGTRTPGGGPREFVNDLDPAVELYDPTGTLVATDDNSAADGRNAQLVHAAALPGRYTVRVLSAGAGQGEYVLQVLGHSGALPAFEVTTTDPSDGRTVDVQQWQITVDFSDAMLLTSLDVSDLTVDGVPATAVTIVDANTAVFDLPLELTEGVHEVVISGGVILDLQGTPIEPFVSRLIVDLTPPRVVESSVLHGSVLPSDSEITFTFRFDEPLRALNLDEMDVSFVGDRYGSRSLRGFAYDKNTSILTLEYSTSLNDVFTLTLHSGDGAFEDLAGNDLDGEINLATTVPSGDGTPGGDFAVTLLRGTAGVLGRYVFYNDSAFDDNNPAANEQDDDAIALDKNALLPTQTASLANYTSYARGLNSIMVDIANPTGVITAADFEFKVGNDDTPADWDLIEGTVSLRPWEGVGLSDRVTILFDDQLIQNEWLQVTVWANENTGLARDDVFYFGNLAGDCSGDGKVDAYDVLETRSHPQPFWNPAGIDSLFDFNRDQRVDAIDTLIARENQTWSMTELQLIDLSGVKSSKLVGPDAVPPSGLEEVDSGSAPSRATLLQELERSETVRRPSKRAGTFELAVDDLLRRGWF